MLSPFTDLTFRRICLVEEEELLEDVGDAGDGEDSEEEEEMEEEEDECPEFDLVACAFGGITTLEKKTKSAAPQSIKVMETHFHNFILKWIRALARCKTKSRDCV